MNISRLIVERSTTALCGGLLMLASVSAYADVAEDMAELKRAIDVLRAENRALADRLKALEAQKVEPQSALPMTGADKARLPIEQRVQELEIAKDAQEDAVRRIIRDSVATLGSKINESASLSGTMGVTAGRQTAFSGERQSGIGLSAADFEFTLQANEWTTGQIKLEYTDGQGTQFVTSTDRQVSVDRLTLDTASIAVGNQTRFPPLLTAGRMVLPFGISTGHPVADVLSVGSPLTVDVFEMRRNAVGLNLAFPTPALKPATPPVRVPVVRPVVMAPLVAWMARSLGYEPLPSRQAMPSVSTQPSEQAPFNAGIYVFDSPATGGLRHNVGGTMGLHAKGHCGQRYEDMPSIGLCPWGLQLELGYNSSVFGSRFLEAEYGDFIDQIGRVPGVAASIKSNLGPFSVVGEWNGASHRARFTDGAARRIIIKPRAWQFSLGYQFDWNPWVQEIGAQGTYIALGYSESRDLAGVTRVANGQGLLVGQVPRKRLLLTAGEWVLDGLRLTVEYARNWDYSLQDGGTGKRSNGLSTTLTYSW